MRQIILFAILDKSVEISKVYNMEELPRPFWCTRRKFTYMHLVVVA